MAEQCRALWPLCEFATLPVSRYSATKCWIVLLSGTLFLPKFLLHCHCVRSTDFAAKYASVIFICCCVVQRSVLSTPLEKYGKKIVKHNFRMKNKIGHFFWTTLCIFWIEFMFMWLIINLLILAMCFAFNLLRKNMFSLLSLFSSIKLIILVDDCSRQEYILVFGFLILASEHLYLTKCVR